MKLDSPNLMCTEMTFEEMLPCLQVWDQTIGCTNCGYALWGEPDNGLTAEQIEEDCTLFHHPECPLQGRHDVAQAAPFK